MDNTKKANFLAIGDIVVDAFIKLKDAHIHCNLDKEGCELCMRFGGKVPYESVTVIPATGNSSNAAVCAARLGLNSTLVTSLGKDENGNACLDKLKNEKVRVKYVNIQKGKNTNFHYVLWYDIDRTILVKHNEFEYQLPKLKKIDWIYLSSLSENSLALHTELADSLKKNPEVKLVFQPGTFQIKFGTEVLKEIYARTEVFFSNLEEAQRILNTEEKDVEKLAEGIKTLGPKTVFISDGINGAYLYHENELWYLPIYPDKAPAIESTGAGDAFSATIVCALALGKTPLEAFTWGPVNAMSVVQKVGPQAGLLSRTELEEHLKNAPENYKPIKIA